MSFNHKTAISWCSTMNRFLSVITGKVMVLHRRKNGECGSGPVAVGQWAAERDRFNVHPVGGRVQDRDCGMLIGGEYNESSKVPIVLMASNEVLGDGDDGDSESLRISLVDSSVVSDDESFDADCDGDGGFRVHRRSSFGPDDPMSIRSLWDGL